MRKNKDFKNSILLLGTGESLFQHREQIKKLNNHITVGFQAFFPHCVKYFDFMPTYWTWFDPHSACAGLDYLLEQKKLPTSMSIVIPYSHTFPLEKAAVHKNLFGRRQFSPFAYQNYCTKLNILRDRGMKMYFLNTVNAFFLKTEHNRLVSSVTHGERFCQNKMICGTTQEALRKPFESKLTYYLFPLAQYMEVKNIFVIGFDGQGGRFYDLKNKVYAGHNLEYVSCWNEWLQEFDMKAYSLADPKYTNLGNYIEYMDIEHAVGLTKFASIEDKNNQIKILENILERKFNKNIYNFEEQ